MLRLVLFLLAVAAVATGLAWLAVRLHARSQDATTIGGTP